MAHVMLLMLIMSTVLVPAASVQRRSDDPDPLEALVEQQASAIHTLQSRLTALEASVGANTQHQSKAVAFTAHFSASEVQVLPKGILRFDVVPVNTGSGYNTHSGIFTAPYSGLYVFLVNIEVTNVNNYLQVAIDKAGTTLAMAHADSNHNDYWDKGTAYATVHLNAGDEVWVRHNMGAAGLYGQWWTTFTGFLLHAD